MQWPDADGLLLAAAVDQRLRFRGQAAAFAALLLAAATVREVAAADADEAAALMGVDDIRQALLLEEGACLSQGLGKELTEAGHGEEIDIICGTHFLQRQASVRESLGRQQMTSLLAPDEVTAAVASTDAAEDPHGSDADLVAFGLAGDRQSSTQIPRREAVSFMQENTETIKRATVRVTDALPQEVRSVLLGEASGATAAEGFEKAPVDQIFLQRPRRLIAGSVVALSFALIMLRSLLYLRDVCRRRAQARVQAAAKAKELLLDAWCTASRSDLLCGAHRKADDEDAGIGVAATAAVVAFPFSAASLAQQQGPAGKANERILQLCHK